VKSQFKNTKFYKIARVLKGFHQKNKALQSYRLMEILHKENLSWPLQVIAQQYGTDKGGQNINQLNLHAYTDFYFVLLNTKRFDHLRILECGIGSNNPDIPSNMGIGGKPGASLRMWKAFFPNAEILGCDIDKNTLFFEDRISTFIADQLDCHQFKLNLENIALDYDLIIDDGLHSFEAITSMLTAAFDFLKNSGIYVVEDLDIQLVEQLSNYVNTSEKFQHHYFVHFRSHNYRDQGGWLLVIHKYS
jgi:hypothetical protein